MTWVNENTKRKIVSVVVAVSSREKEDEAGRS